MVLRLQILGLQVFELEGICLHFSSNTTSGKGYMGAVRHGHFYVVVDKIGTLCGNLVSFSVPSFSLALEP